MYRAELFTPIEREWGLPLLMSLATSNSLLIVFGHPDKEAVLAGVYRPVVAAVPSDGALVGPAGREELTRGQG